MKKIISLFKRDYTPGGTRLVVPEVVPGAEWVLAGEGVATIKYDGTCCMVRHGKLYKRYDRKLTKGARKRHFNRDGDRITEGLLPPGDYKPAPDSWEPAEESPNPHTGHWPGWLPVGDGPEDKWHREAAIPPVDGTCELVGPKVQGNPYDLESHQLWCHGAAWFTTDSLDLMDDGAAFDYIHALLKGMRQEGIVWHHPDGRMVKIKRSDFGLEWPVAKTELEKP